MKNIFLIPTNEPSRLTKINSTLFFGKNERAMLSEPSLNIKAQHIFITSDEKIKEGDWYYDNGDANFICKAFKHTTNQYHRKKIILSTDPTLIADGIQEIDDTFLEWFIENPSCEFVEINDICDNVYVAGFLATSTHIKYEPIIPKDETKPTIERKYTVDEVLDFIDHFDGNLRQAKEYFNKK